MIGPDLVRARRRGEQLSVTELSPHDREEAVLMAEHLLRTLRDSLRLPLDEVNGRLDEFERAPRLEKVFLALKKLALDSCEFGAPEGLDPPALRKTLFELASRCRMELEGTSEFPRAALVAQVAAEHGVSPEIIEDSLFSDLKGAAKLVLVSDMTPTELVEQYELVHVQAVLLRAVRITADVVCAQPAAYRNLFAKLKFRRLLYRLSDAPEGGYRLVIEGPFSLFESVTKYGLQFSLVWPALLECDRGQLRAELRWGKERRNLTWSHQWHRPASTSPLGADLPDDVRLLLEQLGKGSEKWQPRSSEALFDVPGVGIVVPDLELRRGDDVVHVEVLGYWSRDAVWRRVEWAEAASEMRTSASPKIIFAVSSRLRVSESVLEEQDSACLYVYKGKMSAKAVLERAERLAGSP